MSRVTLTDHRVLVLHVLAKRASPQCQSEFLRQGGLRLLPRLIQNALKEESVGELEAIVNLMRALPLDQSMLSFAGLGKSVRKLSKLKSAQRDTVALNAAAQGFISKAQYCTTYLLCGTHI
jgi:exonuclease VII small subunit